MADKLKQRFSSQVLNVPLDRFRLKLLTQTPSWHKTWSNLNKVWTQEYGLRNSDCAWGPWPDFEESVFGNITAVNWEGQYKELFAQLLGEPVVNRSGFYEFNNAICDDADGWVPLCRSIDTAKDECINRGSVLSVVRYFGIRKLGLLAEIHDEGGGINATVYALVPSLASQHPVYFSPHDSLDRTGTSHVSILPVTAENIDISDSLWLRKDAVGFVYSKALLYALGTNALRRIVLIDFSASTETLAKELDALRKQVYEDEQLQPRKQGRRAGVGTIEPAVEDYFIYDGKKPPEASGIAITDHHNRLKTLRAFVDPFDVMGLSQVKKRKKSNSKK